MIRNYTELGKEMIGSWGYDTKLSLSNKIKELNNESELKCLLCYIGELLEPISEIAQLQLEKNRIARSKENEEGIEKRKIITKPFQVKLTELRVGEENKTNYYRTVTWGIYQCLRSYENCDYGLRTASQLLDKPITE